MTQVWFSNKGESKKFIETWQGSTNNTARYVRLNIWDQLSPKDAIWAKVRKMEWHMTATERDIGWCETISNSCRAPWEKKGIKRVHPLYSVGSLSSPIWWSQIADSHCLPWKAEAQPCCAFGPQYYTALSLVHAKKKKKKIPLNHKHRLQSGVCRGLIPQETARGCSSKCSNKCGLII